MGWEQATVGGSVTAEYWQFVPHGDTMDISSLASQHGKDGSQTPLSGLQTPPSAFERRRSSMNQLARAISQPSLAESTSPVSSFYLQRQALALHPDALPRSSTELQRTTSRPQQRASSTPSELDAMPRSSSDWPQHPATSSWQHLQYSSSAPSHRGSFWASQKQWSSNLGPMQEPTLHTHQQQQRQQQQQQQQQQQRPAAPLPPVVQQAARGPATATATPVHQTGLLSEPPSASWGRELPADTPSDHQMALNFSSLAIASPSDLSGTQHMWS